MQSNSHLGKIQLMAFWTNLFGKAEDKYETLRERLTVHEQNSQEQLHATHPHLSDLFAKHQIDLRQIRKQGVRIATAAAVLGAFLAIPHLIGHPSVTTPRPQPNGGKEVTRPVADQSGRITPTAISTQAGTPVEQSSVGTGTPSQPEAPPSDSTDQPDQPSSKGHQGHIHGRSYLAPPKEHGLHDLGLHRGQLKNPQVPEIGPHPSELTVNKKEGKT